MNKFALFDFDGCLVDSLDSIRSSYLNAIKKMLDENKIQGVDFNYCEKELLRDGVIKYIGGPGIYNMKKIIDKEGKLNFSDDIYNELMNNFDNEQYINYSLEKAYPDVIDGLLKLQSEGFNLIIVTARSDKGAKETIKVHSKLFAGINFVDVSGMANKKEEKEDTIERVVKTNNIKETDLIYMIGDKNSDIYAGNKAGENLNYDIKTIMTAYGYETKGEETRIGLNKPDYVFYNFKDVVDCMLNHK